MELMEAREQAALILGVPVYAEKALVKSRWRQIMKDVHPDKGGDVESVIRIQWAAQVLLAPAGTKPPGFAGEPESVSGQPTRQPVATPGIEVQAGPVVWLRSRMRFRLVLKVAVLGVVLLAWLAQLAWTTASFWWGVAVVVPMLVRALWCAFGRPQSWQAFRAERARSATLAKAERAEQSDPPTQPIPVVTEEMLRQ